VSKLAELIAAENKPPNPHQCKVFKLLGELDKADRAVLESALADPSIRGAAIGRALTKLGHEVKGDRIQHHRRGGCECPR
jgi:hypothetical protein